jgi:hypothetical protein
VENLWPTPDCDPTADDLVNKRQDFTEQLNEVVGVPDVEGLAFQTRFVAGQLTYDETVSYVRLSKYKIAIATAIAS